MEFLYLDIICKVQQRSLLGPSFYSIYSNDMVISVKHKLLLYADDSVILVCDKDPSVAQKGLSSDLDTCTKWLIDNKLSWSMLVKLSAYCLDCKENLNW